MFVKAIGEPFPHLAGIGPLGGTLLGGERAHFRLLCPPQGGGLTAGRRQRPERGGDAAPAPAGRLALIAWGLGYIQPTGIAQGR